MNVRKQRQLKCHNKMKLHFKILLVLNLIQFNAARQTFIPQNHRSSSSFIDTFPVNDRVHMNSLTAGVQRAHVVKKKLKRKVKNYDMNCKTCGIAERGQTIDELSDNPLLWNKKKAAAHRTFIQKSIKIDSC